jgi:hypothetical protein
MEKFVKDKNVLNGTIGTAPVPFYPQANVNKIHPTVRKEVWQGRHRRA